MAYGDFRNRSEEKDDSKKKDEASNTKIDPLDRLQAVSVLAVNVLKDDERSKNTAFVSKNLVGV